MLAFKKSLRLGLFSFTLILFALPCWSATMENTLKIIGNTLNIDIFMEDSITKDEGKSLPRNAASVDPKAFLQDMLKGYSYAVLFDGDDISRLWVYKSGKGSFKKVSQHQLSGNSVTLDKTETSQGVSRGSRPVYSGTPPAITYNRGVKKSYTGHAYKKNAFGYKKPMFSPVSIKSNPSGIHSGSYTYKAFKKNKQKAEQDKLMAQAAMMRQLRAKNYKK